VREKTSIKFVNRIAQITGGADRVSGLSSAEIDLPLFAQKYGIRPNKSGQVIREWILLKPACEYW
jgi:hypothetical protein